MRIINIIAYLLVLLLVTTQGFASPVEEETKLHFRDRNQWFVANGKRVKIRGFLCQNDKGVAVLTSQPNIKSCCVNKFVNRIKLFGNIPNDVKTAVTVKGILKLDFDKEPIIEEAVIIKSEPKGAKKWALFALFLACLLGIYKAKFHDLLGAKQF